MELTEKRIDGETRYEGIIVDVKLDRAELSDGRIVKREIVEHPGGVCVLPVDDDGFCYMVRQFRYPPQMEMLEAPAGKLEKWENPRECAVRELSEETGFSADELVYLGGYYTSPGFCTEKLHIYLALGLHAGESHPDDGEFLNVEKCSLAKLSEMVMNHELEDAKTAIAIFAAENYLGSKKS